MNDREYERERRKQVRLERFGTNHPKCLFCTEDDPSCLELHHLSGRAFGDHSVIVCRNHHRKLSDKQKEHPPAIAAEVTALQRLGRLLLGVGDALNLLNVTEQLCRIIHETGVDLIEDGVLSNASEGERS